MLHKTFMIVPGILAATMLLSCSNHQENSETAFSAETIPVKIAPVSTQDTAATITVTGLVTTANEARYAFKIGGVIENIHVEEGQHFKKGQLLASLQITEIGAQLSQASLAYEKAKRDFTRANNLYRDSVATLEQLQNAKTNVDIAAKAREAVAFNQRYARIYAEADGFVTQKLANENEVVSPGSPVLAINETSGADSWTLKLGVTDKEWAAIKTGSNATVTIDAFPGKLFQATVLRKSQAADQSSGSFQVELKLQLEDVRPAVGMFAKATIFTDAQKALATIPYDAIIEADGHNAYVFVPVNENRVKRLPILIERFDNNQVRVQSGLENVGWVVVSNSAFLNEKSTINIIK